MQLMRLVRDFKCDKILPERYGRAMTNQPLPEPPKLTPEDIEAFRKAYEQDWGDKLTETEAAVMARKVAMLYSALAKVTTASSAPPETLPETKELKQPSLF